MTRTAAGTRKRRSPRGLLSGLFGFALLAALSSVCSQAQSPTTPTFRTLEFFVDLGSVEAELAAYQFEFVESAQSAVVVGIEAGRDFPETPYYDPKALRGSRVIVAAYTLAAESTRGKCHVATLHLMETSADPKYQVDLIVAANAEGTPTTATISWTEGQ
ncbi:MAG: hypothetical protein AAF581_09985 [Planctomycetota bacterium]